MSLSFFTILTEESKFKTTPVAAIRKLTCQKKTDLFVSSKSKNKMLLQSLN